MSAKLTWTEASEKSIELENLKAQFEDLLSQASEIMQGTGMTGRRAQSYWMVSIQGCLDDRGCMVTMQDTIDELQDLSNWEPDPEVCPECGREPGEGYAGGCKTCQATEAELNS